MKSFGVNGLLLIISCLLSGCSYSDDISLVSSESEVKPLQVNCGGTPPLLDRTKLKQNLLKSGVITPEMTDEEADGQVSQYIAKRNKTYAKCGKGNHKNE